MFYIISALINFISSFILSLLVLRGKFTRIKLSFLLFSLSISFWSLNYFLWLIAKSEDIALLFVRLLMVGAIFITIFYARFIFYFLGILGKSKYIMYTIYFVGLSLVFLDFTDLVVGGIERNEYFLFWPQAGAFYIVFLLFFFFVFGYSLVMLYRNYNKVSGKKREQIKFIFLGVFIGLLGSSTNYPMWYNINIPPIGNVLVSVYVGFTAYAIVRHRLMDIKFVLRRSTVYLMSLSSVLLPVLLIKYIFTIYFPEASVFGDFLILVLAIALFNPIKNYFYRLANKYFFSSLYDSREVIGKISNKLRTTLEAKHIYDYIYESLADAFHIKSFGVLRYNEKKHVYTVQYNQGFKVDKRAEFKENKFLREKFIVKNNPIIVEEIKNSADYNKQSKGLIDMLEGLGVEILAPLSIKDKTVGLLALSKKESGDMYNDEDLRVLEVVGSQAAIAIENAILYGETKNFAEKLKKEIKIATSDLRKANKQLKELDQAKSDFVSIASHQLRTPLTIIKGYISMMLEGNFGGLSRRKRDPLEKVFESNERLIRLVENLLNISRIESGRLQFNFETIQLEDLVKSEAEELKSTAERKGLKLVYKAPKRKLPRVRVDEEKIRQVIMNLIDNAIKYSRQGKIEVLVKEDGDFIKCEVKDTGVGVKKEDQPNLFKKFSRGEGMFLVNTEGTGLGLYVARQMIEAHDGKIWVESEGVNKGSCFCFRIPVLK